MRQRIRGGIARERRIDGKQLQLDLAGPSVHDSDKLWEYAMFVTDVAYPLEFIGQLDRDRDRDRPDAEERLRRIEKPVGAGRLHPGHQPLPHRGAHLCVGLQRVELVLAGMHPHGLLEADTRRPLLLAAVGEAASGVKQTTLYLKTLHGRVSIPRRLIGKIAPTSRQYPANIGAALQHVKAIAEQFKSLYRQGCLVRYIRDRIAPASKPPRPPARLLATR